MSEFREAGSPPPRPPEKRDTLESIPAGPREGSTKSLTPEPPSERAPEALSPKAAKQVPKERPVKLRPASITEREAVSKQAVGIQAGIEYPVLTKWQKRRDRAILWLEERTERFPGFLRPSFLKILGSPRLKVEFFQSHFQDQIGRGKLTAEEADQYCQEIANGGVNLLLQDVAIGSVVGWASTKALSTPLGGLLISQGYPELGSGLIALDNLTAIWEVPYFAVRAVQEFRHYQKQVSEMDELTRGEKTKLLGKRARFLTGAVLVNLAPLPICWLNALVMTYPRNKGLSGVLINYNLDKMRDGYNKIKDGFRNLGKKITRR